MGRQRFHWRTRIDAPAETVFAWHARPGAFERLNPPWAPARVLERHGLIEQGARIVLRLPLGPFGVRWVAEHGDVVEGRQFRDRQVDGPFAYWQHTHRFEPDGPAHCWLEDEIEYELPLGGLGGLAKRCVRARLESALAYRHRLTAGDLAAHARFSSRPLHFLVSGASGLVGSALIPFLTAGGHSVTRLVRRDPAAGEARWDPEGGVLAAAELAPVDAAVHLAGESVAARWTAERKKRILDSRVKSTATLAAALARFEPPPRVLISASAVGFYGERGDDIVDEDSPGGEGFLAGVCRAWEEAAAPARAAGIRVVHLRIGVVISAAGGALARMLPPFRLGAGGRFGSGKQYVSWIALDDLLDIILHCAHEDRLSGAVNAVSPRALTGAELTETLARVLHRPALLPLPAAAVRLAFGEMGEEMLLASTRVRPARLLGVGHSFRFAELEDALRHTLGRA